MTSLYEQLRGIPRSQLETSIERTQELAAAAFKAKDFKQAYDYYNTARPLACFVTDFLSKHRAPRRMLTYRCAPPVAPSEHPR